MMMPKIEMVTQDPTKNRVERTLHYIPKIDPKLLRANGQNKSIKRRKSTRTRTTRTRTTRTRTRRTTRTRRKSEANTDGISCSDR